VRIYITKGLEETQALWACPFDIVQVFGWKYHVIVAEHLGDEWFAQSFVDLFFVSVVSSGR
jgi:hypothetical protein